jgi:hypothetical protein
MMDYYETNSCDQCCQIRKVRILHHNGVDVLALCAKCAPKLHKTYLPTGKAAPKRNNIKL